MFFPLLLQEARPQSSRLICRQVPLPRLLIDTPHDQLGSPVSTLLLGTAKDSVLDRKRIALSLLCEDGYTAAAPRGVAPIKKSGASDNQGFHCKQEISVNNVTIDEPNKHQAEFKSRCLSKHLIDL